MTVINPSSISGITSITMPSGSNVLTIHTTDGAEKFRIDSSGNVKVGSAVTISQDGDVFFTGVCTATTLSGAASGLTGALPAIDGSALTGIAATDNVRTGILDVAGISTFRNTVNIGAAVTISESGIEATGVGITCANLNGGQFGSRNLVHNGEFIVSQRDFSSAVTQAAEAFTIDRWKTRMSSGSDFSVQQVADAPAGFYNSAKITSLDATTVGASDYYQFQHCIEGYNINPANVGTTTAKPLTLSFHVKSSLTGTFSVCFSNNAGDRFLAQNYTISSADTWEKKTISIPAITTGSWNRDSTAGLFIYFTLGAGSGTLQSTGSWGTSFGRGGTGGANVVATNGATWQITGVQLEVGSQATAFEHRSFAEELRLCQRYYFQGDGQEPGASLNAYYGSAYSSSNAMVNIYFPTTMRAKPTVTNPTHGGGGSLAAVYETFNSIHVNVSSDTSVWVAPSEIKCSAEI